MIEEHLVKMILAVSTAIALLVFFKELVKFFMKQGFIAPVLFLLGSIWLYTQMVWLFAEI